MQGGDGDNDDNDDGEGYSNNNDDGEGYSDKDDNDEDNDDEVEESDGLSSNKDSSLSSSGGEDDDNNNSHGGCMIASLLRGGHDHMLTSLVACILAGSVNDDAIQRRAPPLLSRRDGRLPPLGHMKVHSGPGRCGHVSELRHTRLPEHGHRPVQHPAAGTVHRDGDGAGAHRV